MTEMSHDPRGAAEIAARETDALKHKALEHLGAVSTYGAAAWNYGVEAGVIDPNNFRVDPHTWVSHSRPSDGLIVLGVAPMGPTLKDRLLFRGNQFSFDDEIAYRLGHEVSHGVLFLQQHTGEMRGLMHLAKAAREGTGGRQGLTAIGSLDHYQGDHKYIEDTAELLAMYGWNPNYFADYLDFLGRPSQKGMRDTVGLATLADSDVVFSQVAAAYEKIVA